MRYSKNSTLLNIFLLFCIFNIFETLKNINIKKAKIFKCKRDIIIRILYFEIYNI